MKSRTAPAQLAIYSVVGLLLVGLVGFAVSRGFITDINGYTIVHYVVSYDGGLIRRGLAGEVTSWFADQRNRADVTTTAVIGYVSLQAVLWVSLLAWVLVLGYRRKDLAIPALFAVVVAGQIIPTTAYNVAYLDVYDFLLLLLAAVGFIKRRYVLAIVAGAAGALSHEGFIFAWLSLAPVVLWDRVSWKRVAVLCVPLIGGIMVYLFSSLDTVAEQLAHAPLSPQERTEALLSNFGQSFVGNLELLLWKIKYYPENLLIASVFYCFPAVVLVIAYGWLRRRKLDFAVLAFAAFAPLSIILLAWDLSRFLVGSSFFALFAVLHMETVRPAGVAPRSLTLACSVIFLLLVQVPFINAFFEQATIEDRSAINMRQWPIGQLAKSSVEYFSRHMGPRTVEQRGEESAPGTVWYVEENAWRGGWTRRPGTNIFDAVMTQNKEVITFVASVERDGDTVFVRRDLGSDGSGRMDYKGTIIGSTITGTYPGGRWSALIRR
ncbi:MAG: hypothetical protein KA171_13575 [Reyranella sp.]|nr:hypothetical protein [Reyranella sp.]